MKDSYYITTAIAYPNSKPHIGHALEIIQADVVARFHKLLGKKVVFQTGTDEHGTKNWQTAKKEGKEILEFLDGNVNVFKDLYKKLNISYDYFIRTSDKKIHHPGAIKLWKNLVKAGDIYKKNYKGLYCAGCEVFKTEKELKNNKCPDHPTREIEVVEEENYFFKLSKYKDLVSKKISSGEYEVIPKQRKNEILSFLKEAKDISFSRPKTTLPWGIPVPDDENQVMYVWCDALSNYITGAGYGRDDKQFQKLWPADVHIIGKDILRFHAAFWPAMLLSGKVPLPKKLFVHGFILSQGTKMGKSTGNVIEPFEQIERYGQEQFRFYILGTMPVDSDGEYAENLLVERVNSELIGNLSNFCYRVMSFANKNCESKIKGIDKDPVIKKLEKKIEEVKEAYESFDFRRAIELTLSISAEGNKYFQDKEPWKLEDKKKVCEIIGLCLNLVKNLSILIQPVLPKLSAELQKQLNLKNLTWKDINFNLDNHKIGNAKIIYEKIEKVEHKIKEEKIDLDFTVEKNVEKLGINSFGAIIKGVNVKKSTTPLEKLKKKTVKDSNDESEKINAYTKIYKKLGLDFESPLKHLQEIVKKNKKLPTINTLVDSYNLVSFKKHVAAGAHDISKLHGNPRLKIMTKDDKQEYIALGGKKEDITGEFACVDDKHVLCRLDIKQGEHTKVDEKSKNVFIYVQGNEKISDEYLKETLKEMCENIIKFCGGSYEIIGESNFSKLNLKVAKVLEVNNHPDADKIYLLKLDLGKEKRQVLSGLKEYYKPEELIGKKVVVVSNLEPAKIRGEVSEGMVLTGEDKKNVGVLYAEKSKPGDQVIVEGVSSSNEKLKFDDFKKIKLKAKNGKVICEDKELKTSSETIKVDKVKDGNVR